MRQIQENKKWKRILYSQWALIFLFLVFLIMAQATWKVYSREKNSAADREKAEKSLALALQNNEDLKEQINKLETNSGVEEEIRKKYSVAKPGEEVAVILYTNSAIENNNVSSVHKSWWQQFLDFFKF
jgi:cell division protein FtsB